MINKNEEEIKMMYTDVTLEEALLGKVGGGIDNRTLYEILGSVAAVVIVASIGIGALAMKKKLNERLNSLQERYATLVEKNDANVRAIGILIEKEIVTIENGEIKIN